MSKLNIVVIQGRLGKDVELRYTPAGTPATSFSVAVNDGYKDANGDLHERTDWFDVETYGKPAEIISKHFKKGSEIIVVGSLKTSSWTTPEGKKNSKTLINLKTFHFVGPKRTEEQQDDGSQPTTIDDDLPF